MPSEHGRRKYKSDMMILSTKKNGANYTFASFLLVLAFANYVFANDIHNFAFSRNLLDFANCVFAFILGET